MDCCFNSKTLLFVPTPHPLPPHFTSLPVFLSSKPETTPRNCCDLLRAMSPTAHGRRILGPGGNTFRAFPNKSKGSKTEFVKKNGCNRSDGVQAAPKLNKEIQKATGSSSSETTGRCVPDDDASVESLCSDSSSFAKKCAMRAVQEKPYPADVKRCRWITPHSDQLYITFHDKEWGVPVHGDKRLFELLVFSQALAELSWPAILQSRDAFRKHFDDFDARSVSQFTDAKLISLEAFLSKPKVEAVVENAKQIVKVQQEFGSFNKYCWNFVNHKPIRNSIHYGNQMPSKSPKALLISKEMMQRGFCCVGPTVIYSFMEVAGIVNDHLVSCFRYEECTAKTHENSCAGG